MERRLDHASAFKHWCLPPGVTNTEASGMHLAGPVKNIRTVYPLANFLLFQGRRPHGKLTARQRVRSCRLRNTLV